jgi:hypothetical protein
VATAAISGAVSGGIGAKFSGGGAVGAAARGAVGSAITQGIGVASVSFSGQDLASLINNGTNFGINFSIVQSRDSQWMLLRTAETPRRWWS